jgi:hypothetical protein
VVLRQALEQWPPLVHSPGSPDTGDAGESAAGDSGHSGGKATLAFVQDGGVERLLVLRPGQAGWQRLLALEIPAPRAPDVAAEDARPGWPPGLTAIREFSRRGEYFALGRVALVAHRGGPGVSLFVEFARDLPDRFRSRYDFFLYTYGAQRSFDSQLVAPDWPGSDHGSLYFNGFEFSHCRLDRESGGQDALCPEIDWTRTDAAAREIWITNAGHLPPAKFDVRLAALDSGGQPLLLEVRRSNIATSGDTAARPGLRLRYDTVTGGIGAARLPASDRDPAALVLAVYSAQGAAVLPPATSLRRTHETRDGWRGYLFRP